MWDFNTDIQLSLLFGLTNVSSIARSFILISIEDRKTNIKDTIYTLAYKVINMFIFSNIDELS